MKGYGFSTLFCRIDFRGLCRPVPRQSTVSMFSGMRPFSATHFPFFSWRFFAFFGPSWLPANEVVPLPSVYRCARLYGRDDGPASFLSSPGQHPFLRQSRSPARATNGIVETPLLGILATSFLPETVPLPFFLVFPGMDPWFFIGITELKMTVFFLSQRVSFPPESLGPSSKTKGNTKVSRHVGCLVFSSLLFLASTVV